MITREWLEQEIKNLEQLETKSRIRAHRAGEAYRKAREELTEAEGEVECYSSVRKELEYELGFTIKREAEGKK
jgi:hypothetical protein